MGRPDPLTPDPIEPGRASMSRALMPVERRADGPGVLDTMLRLLAVLALILTILLLGSLLLLVTSLAGAGRGFDGVAAQAQRALAEAERAAQGLSDQLDPAHPPRGTVRRDTEFDELRRAAAGEPLGQSAEYVLKLVEVKKRSGAAMADEAQYAVVRRQLITPRETRVLGQVLRVDRGEQDYNLYRGELFRLGRAYFKVNWVSFERQEVAVGRLRSVDDLTESPKFEVE